MTDQTTAPQQQTAHPTDDVVGPGGGGPLPPAPAARSAGVVGTLSVVLALLTAVLGVVLIREAIVAGGLVSGESWIVASAQAVDGTGQTPAVFLLGLVALLVGIALLALALRRRGRSSLRLRTQTGAYLAARDLAPLVQARASDVPGVVAARARGGPRRLRLDVTSSGTGTTSDQISQAIGRDLGALADPPSVRVRRRAAAGSVPAQGEVR